MYRNRPEVAAKRSEEDRLRSNRRLVDLEAKFLDKITNMAKKKRRRKASAEPHNVPKVADQQATNSHTSKSAPGVDLENDSMCKPSKAVPRVPSSDSFGSSMARVESLDGLFGFPRVASFDNMMTAASNSLGRSTSNESLSSLLPRVSSLEQLSNLAAAEPALLMQPQAKRGKLGNKEGQSSPPQLPAKLKAEVKPNIPSGGLPRVASLDKSLDQSGAASGNESLYRPSSLSNLAGFSENGGISRDPSFQNLSAMSGDYAVGFGLSMSRPISTDKLAGMGSNANQSASNESQLSRPPSSSIPRVSSIEDILAMVNSQTKTNPEQQSQQLKNSVEN